MPEAAPVIKTTRPPNEDFEEDIAFRKLADF
jgi:hypothetical protein